MDAAFAGHAAYVVFALIAAAFGVLFGSNIIVLHRKTANIGTQLMELRSQVQLLQTRADNVYQGRNNDGGNHQA